MFVVYYRVSTAQQGRSGLGLEAQRHAVLTYLRGEQPLAEFTDIESGSKDNRPQLLAALHHAKLTGSTLLVAKLDRLSRNLAFLATLQESGTKFVCADMPEANELTIHVLASVAQAERKMISQRTKEALAAAKARGTKLGGMRANSYAIAGLGNSVSASKRKRATGERAALVMPYVTAARAAGCVSLRDIAEYLNSRQIKTSRGGQWHANSVKRLLG